MRKLVRGTCAAVLLVAVSASAQSIHVSSADGSAVNRIRPDEALGSSVDRLPYGVADKLLAEPVLSQILDAGWQPITYRQNTELHAEAWHWTPKGSWSAGPGRGYFTGAAEPGAEMIRHSYGYPLPRRGITRDDGTDTIGYSRLTDGDPASFWKSNPYLTKAFTGEDDSLLPQWVMLDLSVPQPLDAIRIEWGEPFASRYVVQYWTGTDPVHKPGDGAWKVFPHGAVTAGKGGDETVRLADLPVTAQFIRVQMSESSNRCSTAHDDPRDCVGYAIREIHLGTRTPDGALHDLVRHTPDQDQTATWCSSIDPWHEESDLNEKAGDQVGFDLFYKSGITRGLPAMIPIAMIYNTPEDAANQIAYIEKRGYPISHVEMGEESDGHYMTPEDNAALYIQFAKALHKVDPKLKLGGPVFTGENEDIEVWADASGDTSWTRRWITYLKAHGHLDDLAFFSFEHYPIKPGKVVWSALYDEPDLVTHIMKVWRQDGVPDSVPLFITESNLSSSYSEAYMDIFGGLWLADYVGAFLAGGGAAVYHFHDIPAPIAPGFYTSPGTFAFLSVDQDLNVLQKLSQFHASQLITRQWMQPGHGQHTIFPASSDVTDGSGRSLVTTYAARRPDGQWSLMIVNKDQDNGYRLPVLFDGEKGRSGHFAGPVAVSQFGKAQYVWHAAPDGGHADPDEPPAVSTVTADGGTTFILPPASITVLRGKVEMGR